MNHVHLDTTTIAAAMAKMLHGTYSQEDRLYGPDEQLAKVVTLLAAEPDGSYGELFAICTDQSHERVEEAFPYHIGFFHGDEIGVNYYLAPKSILQLFIQYLEVLEETNQEEFPLLDGVLSHKPDSNILESAAHAVPMGHDNYYIVM